MDRLCIFTKHSPLKLSHPLNHLSINIPVFLHWMLCQITLESHLPSEGSARNIYACISICLRAEKKKDTNKKTRTRRELSSQEHFPKAKHNVVLLFIIVKLTQEFHSAASLIPGKRRHIVGNSQLTCTPSLESGAF